MADTAQAKGPDNSRVQRLCYTDFEIPVGAEVFMQGDDRADRFQTSFVGMERKNFLLFRQPRRQAGQTLQPQASLTVRFLVENLVLGFKATVLAVIDKPFPLLFISYPDCIEALDLRQDDRVRCFLPATLYRDGQEAQGRIVDLSRSGCQVVLDLAATPVTLLTEPIPGAEVFCQFRLPESDEDLYSKGEIRFVEEKNGKARLGIRFVDPEEPVANGVQQFVAATMDYLEGA